MKTTWTKGLTGQDKEEMQSLFHSSARLRSRIKLMIEEKINASRTKSVSEDAYDTPNWALKQADAIGYERALKEIISLMQ
ncbi:MAG TPA: hypothetical protein VFM18_21715 [Methanosarcina sp.]|nr:hypothetical protein [Methanosarcina sp.]